MGKSGSVILGIIMVAVMFVIFPIVMDSAHTLQTDAEVQTEAAVVTGAGVTDADIVLTEALWDDDNTYVTSITSDNVLDTPVAGVYTAGTLSLNVTGLAAADTRTLVLTYEYDGLTDYTGMGALVAVAPLLLFLAVIGAVVGGLYVSFKG
jgi:hypothetical protein